MKPLFSFGIVADCQYADIPDMTSFADRRFRLSKQKLSQAVKEFYSHKVDFVVNLGDTIDMDISSFDGILPIFDKLNCPVRHVAGNHDFYTSNEDERIDRELVMQKLGLKSFYYSWVQNDWRFIVIDGNEEGVIEWPKGSAEWKRGQELLDTLARTGRENTMPWNGGLSDKQIDWLLEELNQANEQNQQVIIFSHQSIYPKHRENILNDEELLPLLAKFSSIKAFINGHNHDGAYGKYNGLHCLTVEGMVDTADNAYALAEVYDNRIVINGYGRAVGRTLLL